MAMMHSRMMLIVNGLGIVCDWYDIVGGVKNIVGGGYDIYC